MVIIIFIFLGKAKTSYLYKVFCVYKFSNSKIYIFFCFLMISIKCSIKFCTHIS